MSYENAPASQRPAPLVAARAADPGNHRALFLSDFHLGTDACKAAPLLKFLNGNVAGTTYLVGDIFDNWRPLGAHWTDEHELIVKLLIARARSGHRMVYLPGNHDAFFLRYPGQYFLDLEVAREAWHVTARGERLLVTHGDGADLFARRLPALAKAGSWIEAGARRAGRVVRAAGRQARLPEWHGIERGISRVNSVVRARDRFEERLAAMARSLDADGIVCGHFHQPALHRDHGLLYANCGDWVEHCSYLAEREDGLLTLSVETAEPRPATEDVPHPLVAEVA